MLDMRLGGFEIIVYKRAQKGAMFDRRTRIIFFLLAILYYSGEIEGTLLSKENDKLLENPALQMCIDSFDVHKDKIIRTQDSQAMGAKYLNEMDLDSRQDCLRLCCETEECDVFIFEEKKPGSCYLFHCGPPHDFKCKFTSHANYSSAVLTNINYRGTVQLEEQIRRTQQEHELKSLRKLAEPAPAVEYSYTEAPPIPVTKAPKHLIPTTPTPIKTRCSRNQYECRTSGDCIAIYNVCDGIPQCADGSDEASELGCPTEKPTLTPVIHEPIIAQTSQNLNKYPANLPHRKIYPPVYPKEQEIQAKVWQIPVLPHQMIGQQQTNVQYPNPQGIIPQINYGPQGYAGGWDYRQMYEQNKEAYEANQMHPKNEMQPYEHDQPRIFKHKSAGVVAQVAGPEENSYVDSNRPYGIDPNRPYYPPQSNHVAWQEGQAQVPVQQTEAPVTPAPKLQHKLPMVTQELPKSTTGPAPCKPSAKQQDAETNKKSDEKQTEHVKSAHVETTKIQDHSKKSEHESEQEAKTEVKVSQTHDHEEHKKVHEEHKPEVRRHHYVAEHLQQNNHKSDNEILRPKGAVISLALGLTATAVMAALIACRLRVVRRRGRRGHGPYAHDADYLVNGMYL